MTSRARGVFLCWRFYGGLLCLTASAQKPELVVQTSHFDKIWSVAFSPDGRILASGSDDNTVKLWEVASGVYSNA